MFKQVCWDYIRPASWADGRKVGDIHIFSLLYTIFLYFYILFYFLNEYYFSIGNDILERIMNILLKI